MTVEAWREKQKAEIDKSIRRNGRNNPGNQL